MLGTKNPRDDQTYEQNRKGTLDDSDRPGKQIPDRASGRRRAMGPATALISISFGSDWHLAVETIETIFQPSFQSSSGPVDAIFQ